MVLGEYDVAVIGGGHTQAVRRLWRRQDWV